MVLLFFFAFHLSGDKIGRRAPTPANRPGKKKTSISQPAGRDERAAMEYPAANAQAAQALLGHQTAQTRAAVGTATIEVEHLVCHNCGSPLRLGTDRASGTLFWRCTHHRTGRTHCDFVAEAAIITTTTIGMVPPVSGG